jgi:hemerythrin superfamily protein
MSIFGTPNPVFQMLEEDHAKVKDLFDQFEKAKDARSKERIIQNTLLELDVHAKLEETLIYPAIRKELDEEDVMDEALEEHHVAHVLINELKRMRSSDGRYHAKFKVLGESIKHHVKEEEGTMFPKAEKADLDWERLQQRAQEQKEVLKARMTNGTKRKGMRRGRRQTASRKTARKRQTRHLRRAA